MNRIADKLRSRNGASITFALLLFLVCAVLCSVIITTASAAAGRMASMAESDQRYYSVTSACEVLKELIDGKTVSVVTVSGGSNAGTYIVPDMTGEQASIRYTDSTAYNVDNNAAKLSIVNEAAYNYGKTSFTDRDVAVTGLPESDDSTPVIKETTNKDSGDIKFTVAKVSGSNTNPYAVEISFTADVKTGSISKTTGTGSSATAVTIDTTTITWSLKDIRTISSTGAGA